MKIGAIIQARLSATRLYGKVLKELPSGSGITVLEQIIRRLKKSKKVNSIIVATTTKKKDSAIVAIAKKEKVLFFRGSENDVLSRYYMTAAAHGLDVIARVSADSPCIDWNVLDMVIEKHLRTGADYTSNCLKRTYPRGFDVEVFNFNTLEKAHRNSKKNYEREHVTPHIYENPSVFKIREVRAAEKHRAPDIRAALDTEEDYALLSATFDYLYPKNRYFTIRDVVRLFRKKPWLKIINKKVIQKTLH